MYARNDGKKHPVCIESPLEILTTNIKADDNGPFIDIAMCVIWQYFLYILACCTMHFSFMLQNLEIQEGSEKGELMVCLGWVVCHRKNLPVLLLCF